MSSIKKYCGIDVSGETIDVCIQKPGSDYVQLSLPNSPKGFKALLQQSGKDYYFVLEATGVYHLGLVFYLHQFKCACSVVNALQIKRYIQMHLERNKSDRKDALRICEYGIERNPPLYEMPDSAYFSCKSLNNAIESLTNQVTVLKNQIHAIEKIPNAEKLVIKCYEDLIKTMQQKIKNLEQTLMLKLSVWQPEIVAQVQSVTGIGKRATSALIVYTQGFKNTHSYQQLISYAGLSPREYSSGSSIRGKARICKQGGNGLRHILYMCALNAKSTNPACKALFDRLVAKGKNKKLAIIAVCNKLLKQVFAMVKNKTIFDKTYTLQTA
jgi:transposase